jgi:protein-L-isoaspartate(D-aspartate) O-methyltransferase
MDFNLPRHKMVTEQLARRGIQDPRVLAAMGRVPREAFVPPALLHKAYDDCALPIDFEQTISQPYTVAFMCQEARLQPTDRKHGSRNRIPCSRSAPAAVTARPC